MTQPEPTWVTVASATTGADGDEVGPAHQRRVLVGAGADGEPIILASNGLPGLAAGPDWDSISGALAVVVGEHQGRRALRRAQALWHGSDGTDGVAPGAS